MASQLSIHEHRSQLEAEIIQRWAGLLPDLALQRAAHDLAATICLADLQRLDDFRFTLRVDEPRQQTLVASAEVAAGIRIAAAATATNGYLYLNVVVIDEDLGPKEIARALLCEDAKFYTYTGVMQRASASDARYLAVTRTAHHPSVVCNNLSGQIRRLVADYIRLLNMSPSWFAI